MCRYQWVSPPANLHCPFRAKNRMLETIKKFFISIFSAQLWRRHSSGASRLQSHSQNTYLTLYSLFPVQIILAALTKSEQAGWDSLRGDHRDHKKEGTKDRKTGTSGLSPFVP